MKRYQRAFIAFLAVLVFCFELKPAEIYEELVVSPFYSSEQNLSKGQTNWVDELANFTPQKYALASNEIFIEFKSQQKANLKTAYQLMIDKNDIYSMFCLSQTLKNISVDFSVVRQNSQNLIYLNTQDKNVLKRVENELKAYDIHSNFKEVKL